MLGEYFGEMWGWFSLFPRGIWQYVGGDVEGGFKLAETGKDGFIVGGGDVLSLYFFSFFFREGGGVAR